MRERERERERKKQGKDRERQGREREREKEKEREGEEKKEKEKVKEHEGERYDFNPTLLYENRFWNRRSDGIVINKNHRTLYILEFKRSPDRIKAFLRVKEDEANEQHRSIIEALQAAAPEWTF